MPQQFRPLTPQDQRITFRPLTPEEEADRKRRQLENLNPQSAALINRPDPLAGLSPAQRATSRISAFESTPAKPPNSLIEAVVNRNLDVSTGLQNPRLRAGTNLAANEELGAEFLRQQGFEAEVDPVAGVVFRNPDTGLLTTVDELRTTFGDVIDPINEAVTIGPEVGGAVGGAIAGGTVGAPGSPALSGPLAMMGATTGGAAGAALGEFGRHKLAQAFGVPEPTNIGQRAGETARTAFLLGGATDLSVGAVQGLRSFLRTDTIRLDPAHIRSVLEGTDAQTSQQLVDEINETLRLANLTDEAGEPIRFRPTPGQLSGDVDLLGEEDELLRSSFRNIMQLRFQKNETALESFLDIVNPRPEDVALRGSSAGASRSGAEVIGVVKEKFEKDIALAERNIADAEADGRMFIANNFEQFDEATIGRRLREEGPRANAASLAKARGAMKRLENLRYKQAREAYGYDEQTATSAFKIPWTRGMAKVIERLNSELDTALFTADAAGKQALTGRLTANQRVFMVDPNGTVVSSFNVGNAIDLDAVMRGLRHLRRLKRQKLTGEVATDPAGKDIIELERMLTKARDDTLLHSSDPRAISSYHKIKDAEAMSAIRARTFDQGIVGSMLTKSNGRLALSNREAYRAAFLSGDRDAIEEIYNIAQRNPRALNEMRKLIFATYRREVAPDGVSDLALHNKFVRNNEALIDTFFPQNANTIKSEFGKFPAIVADRQRDLLRLERQINKRTGNKIVRVENIDGERVVQESITPERLTNRVLSGDLDAGQIREVKQILRAAPEGRQILTAWQQGVGETVRRRLLSGRGPALSVTKIDGLLNQADSLTAMFGPRYVQNLQRLKDGIVVAGRRGGAAGGNFFDKVVNAVTRAAFRPLSRKGLVRHAALTIRHEAADRAAAEIISDPRKLNAFLQLRFTGAGTKRGANILAQIGGTALIDLPVETGEQ
jgi:hypothetical protein